MQQIPIQSLPNQSFNMSLDGNQWDITIKSISGATVVSLARNNVDIIDGVRAVAGSFIIPSQYEEAGNFIFVTQSFQLPVYTQFNITQYLVYVSAAELAVFRAPVAAPITAADFNPIAALPQRFSPQGY